MDGQGSYGPQFSRDPRAVVQNSYLQHSVATSPRVPNNLQQGLLPPQPHLPPPPSGPGFPVNQHGPLALRPELQQVPHGGITNAGQSLPRPHSTVHGNPHPEAQLTSRGLLPVSSQSQASNRAPIHHPPQQLGNADGLRHIAPPTGPHLTSRPTCDPYGSSLHSTLGNSQMSSVVPVLPALEIEPSMQHNHLMVVAGSHSPIDSDMEMEDDITTQSDNDLAVKQPTEHPTQVYSATSSEFDLKEQLQIPLNLAESNAATIVPSDSMLFFSSSGLAEQGSKLLSGHQHLTFGSSVSKIHSSVIDATGATEFHSTANTDILSSSTAEDNTPSKVSATADCVKPDKCLGEVIKVGSPITLKQDYASDDIAESDEEPSKKSLVPKNVSSLAVTGAENMCKNSGLNLDLDTGPNIPNKTEKEFLSESSISHREALDSQREVTETAPTQIAQVATAEQDDTNHENRISFSYDTSPKALVSKYASGGECSSNNKLQRDSKDKNPNIGPNTWKMDKFGRLAREGGSDSDSDDLHHARRHNKRGKSRSRSPVVRRRMRSPRRRRERRGRSRSWSPRNRRSRSRSPRNRRSRSRSPFFRRAGQLSSGNITRDRAQTTECFDFLRGRCYRGSSCRYRHHDVERYEGSRHHRGKQQHMQLTPFSKNSSAHEEIKKISCNVSNNDQKAMTKEMQPAHDMTASSIGATKDGDTAHKRKGYVNDVPQHVSNEDGQLVDSGMNKFTSSRDFTAEVLETQVVQERTGDCTAFASRNYLGPMESNQTLVAVKSVADAAILKSYSEASRDILSKDSAIQQSQSDLSVPVLEDAENPFRLTADSCMLNSSADKISRTFQKMFCASDTVQSMAASVHNPFHLPACDSSSPLAESANTARKTHSTRDHNLMPPTAAVQTLPASTESFPSYMLPNRNTLLAGIPNSSWTSLPTQPPVLPPHDQDTNAGTAPGVASLPSRIDFGSQKHPRPYLNELPGHSQVYDFQWQLRPPELESHQPLLHGEDASFKPLPVCNSYTQQSGFPSPFREDQSTKIPLHRSGSLDSSTQGSNYGQPIPFMQESPAIKLQPFPGNSCSPGEMLKSSSQNHPYLQQQQQQQQPPYFLHQPQSDSVDDLTGRITSFRYPPDLLDRNQPSQPPDTSGVSTHYNPYASTFDCSRPEKVSSHKCEPPSNLGCASIDGQDVASVGSRRATSSSDSPKGIGQIPRSGGDQYDPLFDSIEPSSNSYKKLDHVQEQEPNNDSDSMLRISGSNRPPDAEETNKKEVGGINLAASLDNEECGETTDAEVGDIENASQGNLNTTANIDTVEMEIDQIKSPVKGKRSKESRSLKLFKACLAEFVKEVLKPSWQQGNMSKEAFKTVVKKTVDKVSEAMKSHHIPKSKAKINQYIDSSQLKLTKLVMGYVDKYAKG